MMAGSWQMMLFLLCLMPATLPAVRINAKGREVIYLAKGQSAKLVCPYELEPHDHGPNSLDIEWTQMNSDPTSLDNVILSYHDHQVIHPGYAYIQQRESFGAQERGQLLGNPDVQQNLAMESSVGHRLVPVGGCCSGLQQRVNFVLPDPSQYDASINLQNVQISDSATYECKVKKTTLASRKVTIMVLERPSVPKCSIMGKVAVGREVTLSCASDAGSNPLMYQWARVADHLHGNLISALTTKGLRPGDIIIKNLSREHAGIYQCSVANKVGRAQCTLEVTFEDNSNKVSILVGAVLGSLLFLVLLLCLIVGLICCFRRRRCKEEAKQIRVDRAPPQQRGGSKSSSRSVLGSLLHKLSFRQERKYKPPKEQESIEMICPPRDPSPSVNSSRRESEVQNRGSTVSVTTEARVHYAPAVPSCTPSKSRAMTSPPVPGLGGTTSSTFGQVMDQRKLCHGDVPARASAKTREDLVV